MTFGPRESGPDHTCALRALQDKPYEWVLCRGKLSWPFGGPRLLPDRFSVKKWNRAHTDQDYWSNAPSAGEGVRVASGPKMRIDLCDAEITGAL
jgi:hypothetical protein